MRPWLVAGLSALIAVPLSLAAVVTTQTIDDAGTLRTVYTIDSTEESGPALEVVRNAGRAACALVPSRAQEGRLESRTYPECASSNVPAIPRVLILSAAVQKAGGCSYPDGLCPMGYIRLRFDGLWTGTYVLSTHSDHGPNETLAVPLPPNSYGDVDVRVATGYTAPFVLGLRLVGASGETLIQTYREVDVREQPLDKAHWVPSAEYVDTPEYVTVTMAHVAPPQPACLRTSFAIGPATTLARAVAPFPGFLGGPLHSTGAPVEVRAGVDCEAPTHVVTTFAHLNEVIPVPSGGAGSTNCGSKLTGLAPGTWWCLS